MKIERPLMPGFLKRAEQKLLLNNPLIWSTRVHLVLYYGILYNLFLTGLSYLAPMNIMGRSNTEYWVGFQIIIAIIALTIWLIYLLRFNVFKKYGNIKPLHALVTFLLYFISTGIIIQSVYIYPIVECLRANAAFGDKELVQDINNLNIKLCQFEYKVLNTKWSYDTVHVVNGIKKGSHGLQHEENAAEYDTAVIPDEPTLRHSYYTLDSVAFNNRLAYTDSLVKLNDSLYLFYRTPNLQFISSYMLEEYGDEKLLPSFEIYNRALRHPPTPAAMRTIAKELNELERKYARFHKSEGTAFVLPDDEPGEVVRKKHPIGYINNNISNITSKKYSFSERRLNQYLHLFYYFTLGITLLIFIFRHTTVRTFFLSLLSGILLLIFTAIVLEFSRAGSAGFTGWMICYTLLFFIGSVFTFSLTKRNVVNGILINLFVFIIHVFPVLIVDFIFELNREQYVRLHGGYYPPYASQFYLYAEIGGAVLLLVLLAAYINKLYRRWYSLPGN